METDKESVENPPNDEKGTRKILLQAVIPENDLFTKYINKNVIKKISCVQIIIAVIICVTQMVSMSLVLGRNSWYDNVAEIGGGIWSSFVTMGAAVLCLWNLKELKSWKFYLSFVMHLFSMITAILLIIFELSGTIVTLAWKIGENCDNDEQKKNYYYEGCSVTMLIISLILNSSMAIGGFVQLAGSMTMTWIIGKAVYFGQIKSSGSPATRQYTGLPEQRAIYRLRNLTEENNSFPKCLNTKYATSIPRTQILLSTLICVAQIVTMSLELGYNLLVYDNVASIGAGLWSSMITMSAAVLTLWSLKSGEINWKFYISFVLYIGSMITCIVMLVYELNGNINSLKYQIGSVLYTNDYENKDGLALKLIIILTLNSVMTTLTLVQLVLSFFMTLMYGKETFYRIFQGQTKLFELEIGNDNEDSNEEEPLP